MLNAKYPVAKDKGGHRKVLNIDKINTDILEPDELGNKALTYTSYLYLCAKLSFVAEKNRILTTDQLLI